MTRTLLRRRPLPRHDASAGKEERGTIMVIGGERSTPGAVSTLNGSGALLSLHEGNLVLTPHAGEMAALLCEDKESVLRNPLRIARSAASAYGAVALLKGAETLIARADGRAWRYAGGDVGLATSGSGDVLAGIIAGLAARGADATTAALWGVFLHGEAGNVLASRQGRVGFLAREIAPELPALMERAAT